MTTNKQIQLIEQGWAHLTAGEMDELASMYTDDMIFILPGQNDQLNGKDAFRAALDNIGAALPPGFDIKALHYFSGDLGVTNVVEWTSEKLPKGSQCAIIFRFNDQDMITEERWFVDTEQWKAAF